MKLAHPLCLLAVLTAGIVAAQAAVVPAPAPRKAPNPEMRAKMLAKSGGFITQTKGDANILLLNLQDTVKPEALQAVADSILNTINLEAVVKTDTAKDCPIGNVAAAVNKANALVIGIVDTDNCSTLLLAPEDRWAVINVANLKKGADAELLKTRVQKEIWRALAITLGAANSTFAGCVMKPVFKIEDLDALKPTTACPEPFNKMIATAGLLNLKTTRKVPYRAAVEQGWAPAPTNDIQKAVWEDVKNKPAKK